MRRQTKEQISRDKRTLRAAGFAPSVSVRYVRRYDDADGTLIARLDVLWGVSALNAELACRVVDGGEGPAITVDDDLGVFEAEPETSYPASGVAIVRRAEREIARLAEPA